MKEIDPRDFLRAVYMNADLPLSVPILVPFLLALLTAELLPHAIEFKFTSAVLAFTFHPVAPFLLIRS